MNIQTRASQVLTSHTITQCDDDNGLGLQVDQAALVWLQKQLQPNFKTKVPVIHPLAFIQCILAQVYHYKRAQSRILYTESFRNLKLPWQHINDHHFTRCMRYLCTDNAINIKSERIVQAGDIVIFSEYDLYTRMHWAICGSAGRLYHVRYDHQTINCSYLSEVDHIYHVMHVSTQ